MHASLQTEDLHLETPNEGNVNLFQKNVNKLNEEKSALRLHSIGSIFQFFNLIPSLTVLENIELPLALAGTKKQERKKQWTYSTTSNWKP
jgi:ABC-type lipoprotein export system ATPase subunit